MKTFRLFLISLLTTCLFADGVKDTGKLNFDQRVEIVRGLMAEFATVKTFLPRSKKPLPIESSGKYDKKKWDEVGREFGPAARVGDLVQITKVTIEDQKILFEINGGMRGKRKWYENVEVGMGGSTSPIRGQGTNAPGGTYIVLEFGKPVPGLQAAEIKKILAPILDFEKHSATEQAMDSLPPEVAKAVKENRAIEGMDRDQVIMALGKPRTKSRETKEGMELEDWIYGNPPGKLVFVTFNGNKVLKVKETYAGLGGQTAPPLPVQ
ncbi:MAG: hypothetical protein ABJF23_14265 [Bryobacteraceae bacterium]